MQDSNTSLAALQSLLQPLLDAEQHLPPQLPVLVPLMTPAERSAMLRRQMSQQHGAVLPAGCASSSSNSSGQNTCQQQCNNRTAHLLRNVQLLHETLSYMNQEEGFRQVATGPLSMWYCHDVAAESQLIRAKVVLEESVAVSSTVDGSQRSTCGTCCGAKARSRQCLMADNPSCVLQLEQARLRVRAIENGLSGGKGWC
jgi:hypothetical protein